MKDEKLKRMERPLKANKVAFMEYYSVLDGEKKRRDLANRIDERMVRRKGVIEYAEGQGNSYWDEFYDKKENEYMEG
jgi:hypothetical protein